MMEEKDIVVDACYVIGTALLFKKSVDRQLLNRVEQELSLYYEINLSEEKVSASVEEWKDFFRFDSEGNVVLTSISQMDKTLIRILFADGLEPEIYEKVLNSIFHIGEKKLSKTKILKFPQ